jgi:membrane associated rhomboid family serine protease
LITEFLFKKKPKFPAITFIFAATCLLVSVPTYFNAELYEIFSGEKPMFYAWQPVTNFFEHGTSISFATLVSLPLHIAINLAMLLTFGIVCEKLLGAKWYLMLIAVSGLLSRAVGAVFETWANGASSITWGFAPIAFYFTRSLYKRDRRSLMYDRMFYVFCFLFFFAWIMIAVFDILYGAYIINTYHLFATLAGTGFLLVFRKSISERIRDCYDSPAKDPGKIDILDKAAAYAFMLLPALVLAIFILWFSGGLTRHISSSKIETAGPKGVSIESLNEAGEIRITFTEPMKHEITHSGVTIDSLEGLPPLTHQLDWPDERTIRLRFSREFTKGETVSVLLWGFRDLEYRKFYGRILLEYGFDER